MKRRFPFSALSFGLPAIVTLLSAADANAQSLCGAPQPANCFLKDHTMFNVRRFADQVANELRPLELKGYSLNVYGEDGESTPVLAMSKGQASGGNDPLVNYTTSVAQTIASVSKMLTQGAIRHAMEISREATGVSEACRVSNTTSFLNLLPDAFRRAAMAGVPDAGTPVYSSVTIDDILLHKGGVPFAVPLLPDGSGPDFWIMMNRGVADSGVRDAGPSIVHCPPGEGCYTNNNYVLATIMLPIIRNCALRASIESETAAYCFRNPPGRSRDTCQIQRTYETLSLMSNAIVNEMVIEPLSAKANCDYDVLLNQNIAVARAYADGGARSGVYPFKDPAGCGIYGWHMSTAEAGRILRRFWDGSFFNHSLTGDEMPIAHNGFWMLSRNGVNGSYGSHGMYLMPTASGSESLTAMFSANSPVNTAVVDDIIYRAFQAAQRTSPPAVSQRILTTHRGTWDCTQIEAPTAKMSLRISNRSDIRAFHPADYSGQGAEELWTDVFFTSSRASGRYTYYQAAKSPKTDFFTGNWSMEAVTTDGGPPALKVQRIDGKTGWRGNYNCTRVDNR